MKIEKISGAGTSDSPNYSAALRVGDFVFVSGQASLDAEGKIVRDGFEAEMRRAISNLEAILASAGLGLTDVVQVRAYIDDPRHLEDYNRIYREYFTSPMPTRTTLSGCLGDVVSFELDVVACTSAPTSD